jgi:hypothetical protein
LVALMTIEFQNPFQQPEPPLVPGRVIIKRSPWRAPLTNRPVDLIATIQTYEINGVIRTEEIDRAVFPPLDDGTVPSSTSEIRECARCLSLISCVNAFTCVCGRTFCLGCGIEDEMNGRLLCIECYENRNGGGLEKFWKWLWS